MNNDNMEARTATEAIVKKEPLSRETSPFSPSSLAQVAADAAAPQSRHNTPPAIRPSTPVVETNIPCSQETTNTVSTAPRSPAPKPKIEDAPATPLAQDSPSNNPELRRKKKKTKRSKGIVADTTVTPVERQPPAMKLTHANKQWFDIFQAKQSSQSVSTFATDHPNPTHIRVEEQFNYVKEIFQRSFGWVMLPLRWGIHWAAIYLLPFAIALAFFTLIVYMVFPRYIFSAIPSILTTTTSILAFPARMAITKTPQVWCNYVGIGCGITNSIGEEVVRNATFATDLEVRNAYTVIHNINDLNNSSNRLILDSVIIPTTSLTNR
jgi:hypothetical protein